MNTIRPELSAGSGWPIVVVGSNNNGRSRSSSVLAFAAFSGNEWLEQKKKNYEMPLFGRDEMQRLGKAVHDFATSDLCCGPRGMKIERCGQQPRNSSESLCSVRRQTNTESGGLC